MEAIVVEFEVSTSPGHAFDVWTSKPSMWWPRSHTVTQDPRVSIIFEPYEGGRIYERGPDGAEHDWGEVLLWEPPARIGYLWHLFFDRSEATEVTVTFRPLETGTLVTLTQTGFEKLGDPGIDRRRRTNQAWLELTGHYRGAIRLVRKSCRIRFAVRLRPYMPERHGGVGGRFAKACRGDQLFDCP